MDDATSMHRLPGEGDCTVVVNRGVKRNRDGSPHKGSARAIVRHARALHPSKANWGVREILYGTRNSTNTVVVFNWNLTRSEGLLSPA